MRAALPPDLVASVDSLPTSASRRRLSSTDDYCRLPTGERKVLRRNRSRLPPSIRSFSRLRESISLGWKTLRLVFT